MRKGFFDTKPELAPIAAAIAECGKCGLYKGCESPMMPVTGEGSEGILMIAEAPGAEEDKRGVQLIGKSGQYLRRVLSRFGHDLDEDCWKTNVLTCRPPNNATPTEAQIRYCLPNLVETIKKLRPRVIVPLDAVAIKAVLLLHQWTDYGSASRWEGWRIPSQKLNAWVCPTYHPSYAMRENDPVLNAMIEEHLKEVFELGGRPWATGSPDYRGQVELIHSPSKASKRIDEFVQKEPIAFDYETNRLKPDAENARIATCSMSNGRTTIAYPWHGEAIVATRRLLESSVPKIASNMKFEDRWTRHKLGFPVRHWLWDTMLAAHVLDNRRGVSGLKFQAFVRLGVAPYDAHVKLYLESTKEDGTNRIDEVDLDDLLLYNGIDSLLEYKVAMIQRKEMGFD